MSLISWLRKPNSHGPAKPRPRNRPPSFQPRVEVLERRALLATFSAGNVPDLIADINAANKAGGANTILLTAPTDSPYVISAVNNSKTFGNTVLPVVAKGNNLTIQTALGATDPGYGDTLDAAHYGRLFVVAAGGSLMLQNVTLQNGLAYGKGVSSEGGAVYNQGTLILSAVMIQNNAALGIAGGNTNGKTASSGEDAAGGGIYSTGALTIKDQTIITNNSSTGGEGGYSYGTQSRGAGGNAYGGGVAIIKGTATITDTTFGIYNWAYQLGRGNVAQGGLGSGTAYGGAVYVGGGTVIANRDTWNGNAALGGTYLFNGTIPYTGFGYGGGLYIDAGTVTLTNDVIVFNGAGDDLWGTYDSNGLGGGIYIASHATVYLDSYTVANTVNNTDVNDPSLADIDGAYVLLV